MKNDPFGFTKAIRNTAKIQEHRILFEATNPKTGKKETRATDWYSSEINFVKQELMEAGAEILAIQSRARQ